MMRNLIYAFGRIILLLSLLMFGGCDIHEWPDKRYILYPFTLNLDFHSDLSMYEEISYVRNVRSISENSLVGHDVRYLIKAYRMDDMGDVSTFVYTHADVSSLNHDVQLELPEGAYKFLVWTDYVDSKSVNDKYYDTSDFQEIILIDKSNHKGSNEFRDVFRGYSFGEVEGTESTTGIATVTMERPMGKFKFIATDADVFIKTMQNKGSLLNMEDYKVIFRYNYFMPCSYNLVADMTADSWTGMSFESRMFTNLEDQVELGYDYVFVNDNGTTLSVCMEVYDKDGSLLAACSPINVPIVRNKMTKVSGNFLTSKSSGGIQVSTEYEGNFNIEIN